LTGPFGHQSRALISAGSMPSQRIVAALPLD